MEITNILILTIITTLHCCVAIEVDFTFEVGAGKRDCFHQYIKNGVNFEVEYQVIDGGDLDLNFVIQAPSGKVLLTDVRKTESLHKFNAGEDGDYAFCMDNTFSRFTEKLVFFELITDEDEEDINVDADYQMDEKYEMKVEDFRKTVETIRERLDDSISVIKTIKSIEARDRALAEDTFEVVNLWSGMEMFVLITVALIQVLMIHSFFKGTKANRNQTKLRT